MMRALSIVWALLMACGGATQRTAEPEAEREIVSDPDEYMIETVSADAGEAIFMRTGIGDPYRTGLAYPVFLGLLAGYPDLFGADFGALAEKFGFHARAADPASSDPDVREGLPLGLHLTIDPNTRVPFVVSNCALCHVERVRWAGGEAEVIGLGNRRVRIHDYDAAFVDVTERSDFDAERLGALAREAARARDAHWPREWAGPIVQASVDALRERAERRAEIVARTRGGPPGRVAPIESFAVALSIELGREIPMPEVIGWSRVQDVIGFPVRTTLSFDAAAQGSLDALVVEADFAAGARPQWFWDHPFQGPSLSAFLRRPRPRVPFPGPIDRALAEAGRAEFERECTGCHGHYDAEGRSVGYRERVIGFQILGTDPARTLAVTDAFVEAANDPELTRGIVRTRRTNGYVPPVLTGIWMRAPYGHVGQWPSLRAIGTPPSQRPARYVIDLDGEMDLDAVGRRTREPGGPLAAGEHLVDATAPGFSNAGHPFLADLEDSRAVIEYLKTL